MGYEKKKEMGKRPTPSVPVAPTKKKVAPKNPKQARAKC
jgi:hypothetical protein